MGIDINDPKEDAAIVVHLNPIVEASLSVLFHKGNENVLVVRVNDVVVNARLNSDTQVIGDVIGEDGADVIHGLAIGHFLDLFPLGDVVFHFHLLVLFGYACIIANPVPNR